MKSKESILLIMFLVAGKEFPSSQKSGSFGVDQALDQLQSGGK